MVRILFPVIGAVWACRLGADVEIHDIDRGELKVWLACTDAGCTCVSTFLPHFTTIRQPSEELLGVCVLIARSHFGQRQRSRFSHP